MNKKKFLIGLIVFLSIVVVAGAMIDIFVLPQITVTTPPPTQPVATNTSDNSDIVVEEIKPPEPAEIYSLGGKITSITGDQISMDISTLESDNPELASRVVTVDAATKIYLLINKTNEEFEKELADFQIQMEAWSKSTDLNKGPQPISPIPLKERRDGQMSDLEIGQQIFVSAAGNIKEAKNFTAAEILVQNFQKEETPVVKIKRPTPSQNF